MGKPFHNSKQFTSKNEEKMNDTLKIILNGKIVNGKLGETILGLANRCKVSIPTLCNDPRLTPNSSCFVCVVDVGGQSGLQPACSTKVCEGMKINTENERVRKARKSALDQLVNNHYADCIAPCKQNFTVGIDVSDSATITKSIHQSKEVAGFEKKEFISRRIHFHDQSKKGYLERCQGQLHAEMPTVQPGNPKNFDEVGFAHKSEELAYKKMRQGLEYDCSAYFTCDLKKYATEYGADQQKHEGNFEDYELDFSHPYIEIDNNKCILCARCVRICKEVVGADALRLVECGNTTYLAPRVGKSLRDTNCESCGICISTCPTGAITENVNVKTDPVKYDTIKAIDNYGSEGFEINLHHKDGFVMRATGRVGDINFDGNISRQAKFGYAYLNDPSRITKPLLKKGNKFEEISFDEAFAIICDRIKGVEPDENAFFAGARLTNEEIYMVQKLSRAGAKTNNVNCFHYLGRGIGYGQNASANVPFEDIKNASRIFVLSSNLHMDSPLVNHMVFNARNRYNVPVELVTNDAKCGMKHKVDKVHEIKDFYYFVKTVNYFLISSGLQNQMFINDRSLQFEEYKMKLIAEDFDELFEKSGVRCIDELAQFAKNYNNEPNAILVFTEKELSSNVSFELFNLAIITGKLGKASQGLLALKEKNNAQGIIEMGGCHKIAPGFQLYDNPLVIAKLRQKWSVDDLPETIKSPYKLLKGGLLKNILIFGEDPVGCAVNRKEVEEWFAKTDFMMVQDYFITETAEKADLIMPASLPIEIGGSFTTTQKRIQKFEKQRDSATEITSPEQIDKIMAKLGLNKTGDLQDALCEAFGLLPPTTDPEKRKFHLHFTQHDNYNRMFEHGCDIVNKRFDDEFENAF